MSDLKSKRNYDGESQSWKRSEISRSGRDRSRSRSRSRERDRKRSRQPRDDYRDRDYKQYERPSTSARRGEEDREGYRASRTSDWKGDGDDKRVRSVSSSKDKKKDKKKKEKKSKRSRKRESSSDSDTSISSDDSAYLLLRLEEERKKQKVQEKKRKEDMKILETPEEKRQRRLGKKEGKERKRKERMGWDTEQLDYTNADNPFGDSDLLGTFVWGKKLVKQGLNNLSKEDLERINRLKQEENKLELEKVKKRRLEKEREMQARDEEQQLLQRQKEADQFQEWGDQEDVFQLEQARLRSKIRIKDGRAKPIDLLAQYISAEDEVDAIEMHEPYKYLNGLNVSDLEDLLVDIKVYKEMELGTNLHYWNDITVIVEDELRKLRKLEQDDDYRMAIERREGINPAVASDVNEQFKGKTAEKLEELKLKIQEKLDGSVHGLDISYWESLLSQLKAHIARARLRDRHQDNLLEKLALLKAQQGVKVEQEDEENEDIELPNTQSPMPGPSTKQEPVAEGSSQKSTELVIAAGSASEEEEDMDDGNIIDESIQKYLSSSYSPRLIGTEEIEPGIFVIGEEEDNARLDLARSQVLQVGQKVENVWTAEEKALEKEAKKGITNDEAGFSVEAPVEQIYLWSDKYRPRKPRYFNRVHTGFEWNKYNQTHYDMDNPPPKIVQGYKFNIFYPDLIDKSSTPRYTVTACADNPDFAILRFQAGPPYEDIGFKVVNREWEYSYKRGFRCQFHNNIFQLWFHFKRYRYRR